MKYTRLYADDAGESHFQDVAVDFSPAELASASPPLNLSELKPAAEFGFMSAPAGWSSDWHPSSGRNFFVVLTGEWEVTASDGETRRFAAGSALLVEDTEGKGHTSQVLAESISVLVQLPR
jgi:quercetin dioxygenase-like cupin family protein